MSILYLTLLFVILSPGVLLTIPPCSKGLFMSGQTSLRSVLVHAVVFYLVAVYVLPELTSRQVMGSEGFKGGPTKKSKGSSCTAGSECSSGECKTTVTRNGTTRACT